MLKHTVKRGENLHDIGKTYNMNWRFIAICNMKNNPHLIHPNEVIKIPFRKKGRE